MGMNTYELDPATKATLLQMFAPRYAVTVADHITQNFGVAPGTPIPDPKSVKILGVADDGRGIQALIVEVNGERLRPDGKPFHISWSHEPSLIAPAEFDPAPLGKQKAKTYRPAHANKLVELGKHSTFLETPLEIAVTAHFIEGQAAQPSPVRG